MDNDEEIINFRGKSRASYYRHKKFIANALTSRVSDCEETNVTADSSDMDSTTADESTSSSNTSSDTDMITKWNTVGENSNAMECDESSEPENLRAGNDKPENLRLGNVELGNVAARHVEMESFELQNLEAENAEMDSVLVENNEENDEYFDAQELVSDDDDSNESSSESEDEGSIVSDTISDTSEDYYESEQDFDADEIDFDLGEPLYDGSELTVAEYLICVLALSERFKLSNVSLDSILSLIHTICPVANKCPSSLYKLKKIFSKFKCSLQRIYYCPACTASLENEDSVCSRCDVGAHYFIKMPILEQIRKLMRRPNFLEHLKYRFTRKKINEDNFEDFYDGAIYKSLSQEGEILSFPTNISLMWNTDGVRMFKSSDICAWPFYFKMLELSPDLRNKKENLILAGIWFGKEKPCPNLFMLSFYEEMQELYRGIDCKVEGLENPVNVRGITICGTCDSPAKSLFLNMTQFNGYYGCPKCKIEGEHTDNRQLYKYQEEITLRTTEETVKQAQEAVDEGVPVQGVKGPTVLSLLVLNFIITTVLDDLHSVYLGVVKLLMTLLLDSEYRGERWSLFQQIGVLNERLCSITPPNFVKRLPRSVSDLAYWKGLEFKLWLLVYSLPMLFDLLDPVYLEHHKLLVYSIYLLSQSSISNQDILTAENLLNQYVKQFGILYGTIHMTSNIHALLHLGDNVRNFGPLPLTSCFVFEDLNGQFKNFVHGTRYPGLQIMSAASFLIGFANMKAKILRENSAAQLFCDKLNKCNRRRKLYHLFERTHVIGTFQSIKNVPDLVLNVLQANRISYKSISLFHRVFKDGIVFNATSYKQNKKLLTDSSCITYNHNNEFNIGIFVYFIKVNDCKCVGVRCLETELCTTSYYGIINKCKFTKLKISSENNMNIEMNSFYKLENTDEYLLYNVTNDFKICFLVKMKNCDFMYAIEPAKIISVE